MLPKFGTDISGIASSLQYDSLFLIFTEFLVSKIGDVVDYVDDFAGNQFRMWSFKSKDD